MTGLSYLLYVQCILLFSTQLAKDNVVNVVIWISAIISAVFSGLTLGKTLWSPDRALKKRDVLLNISTTIAFFMALQYSSLHGFFISQIASQVLFGLFEQRLSKLNSAIYVMPLIALLLQLRIDGLTLLLGCAYNYLAHVKEQTLEENVATYTQFYSNALLSVLALPLAIAELNFNWSTQSWAMLAVGGGYALHKRMSDKFYEVICLAAIAVVAMVHIPVDLLTVVALALVVIGYFLLRRIKASPEDSPQTLNVDANHYSQTLNALALIVVCTAFLVYAHGITAVASKSTLGPVQLNVSSIDSNYNVPYNASLIPIAQEKDAQRLQCLFKARKMINERLSKLIAGSEALSLMDVPLHWNLGDSFIWHGDNLFMSMQSLPVVTPRDPEQRELETLRNYSKNVSVLLHGGGNFGDWWRENADFRLKVLNETSNRVIFLPQSISYREEKYALQDRAAFEKHGKLTLLLRDTPSLKYAREKFPNTESVFVPDMAFMIGPIAPADAPIVDILFLLRSDTEKNINDTHITKAKSFANEKELSYEIWDFPVDGYPIQKSIQENHSALYDYRRLYPNLSAQDIPKDILPIFRVAMGNKLLSRGSVIVTDRLHASIMSVLIGRPVIYVDNAYKKLSNIWSSMASYLPDCNGDNLRAKHADTLDRAVELAYEWIRDTRK